MTTGSDYDIAWVRPRPFEVWYRRNLARAWPAEPGAESSLRPAAW